ncbi:hypothetical protein JM18_004901 [Phytophthora kernoviae]|uniref:FYVE-type domain-containing protein n=3 Tax=Phytophthora kernoviae TaxID=325452 RepID=A0A8T0LS92_9STRA|nr:hypothetical protein G195_008818 [Phytophthora kernoviae 00238/432]KAG2518587.1 hypothetical protein JM16_005240 [Phytophthora kernoviae]KAG2520144.1 hypothetical protein JM18_004901 [Phytophthora kernoviae]
MLSVRRTTNNGAPPRHDAFRKSSRNPLNMSRTAGNKTTGHAPSTLMLERMREAAADLATLATTTAGWRFTNERNGTMLYEISVNFQDVPELPIPECTDRLHFRNSGFVIEETTEPNVFRLSLLLSLLPTKVTLKYAKKYQRWLQTLASCAGNLALVLRPEVTLHCLSKLTWKQSDHCFMCLKMFRTFRRCHHCRFCGEAVCGACSSMVNMAGYEVTDGSGSTLAASTAGSLVSSRHMGSDDNTNFAGTGDVWQMSSGDGMGLSRRDNNTRGYRETRGCSACIADLHHGLTASAIMSRRNSDSSEYSAATLLPRTNTGLSGSNDDEDVISYDSADDVTYERLGSVATYIPSDEGEGVIVQQPQKFNSSGLYNEPMDEFPVTSEELQDKFPAVDQPAPPRFRNVSDPDQLRRMRNVSDPELPMRFKDKHSIVSMSTATSSFSRSSHETRFNDTASQYSRGTNFSAMSDGSSACDLSRDPDILALAGLTLKPRPSDDQWEFFSQKTATMSHNKSSDQVLEEPEKEMEAEVIVDTHTLADRQQLKAKQSSSDEEDSFTERVVHKPWPGSSNTSNSFDARHRSNTVKSRDDFVLHPADVLRHRSQTTAAMAWNPAATAPMPSTSPSASNEAGSASNKLASSTIRSVDTFKPTERQPVPEPAGAQFHFSRMQSQPSSTTAAIVAAVAAVSSGPNSSLAPAQQTTKTQQETAPMSKLTTRRGSVPKQMHQMHRLPASVPEGSTVSDDSDRNDMIPLPLAEQPKGFVMFSDSRRESIFTRPDDGQDMIPLKF